MTYLLVEEVTIATNLTKSLILYAELNGFVISALTTFFAT